MKTVSTATSLAREASAGKRRDHDHEGDGEQDAELEERDGEDRDAAEDESEYAPVDAFEGAVATTGEEQSAKAQAAAEQGQNDAEAVGKKPGPMRESVPSAFSWATAAAPAPKAMKRCLPRSPFCF